MKIELNTSTHSFIKSAIKKMSDTKISTDDKVVLSHQEGTITYQSIKKQVRDNCMIEFRLDENFQKQIVITLGDNINFANFIN